MISSQTPRCLSPSIPCSPLPKGRASLWGRFLWRGAVSFKQNNVYMVCRCFLKTVCVFIHCNFWHLNISVFLKGSCLLFTSWNEGWVTMYLWWQVVFKQLSEWNSGRPVTRWSRALWTAALCGPLEMSPWECIVALGLLSTSGFKKHFHFQIVQICAVALDYNLKGSWTDFFYYVVLFSEVLL